MWPGFLLLFFISFFLGPSSDLTIISNLEKKLQEIKSLEADFIQIYFPAYESQGIKEKGRLYLRRPDQMRWDYFEPEKKCFLLKGDILLSYFFEDKQIVRQPLDEEIIKQSILGLLTGKTKLLDLYSAEIIARDAKSQSITLKLEPLEDQEITKVLLEIDTRRWLIVKIVFYEASGVRQEFLFSRHKFNPTLSPKIFDIPVPEDWEIINSWPQDKKKF